MHTMPPTSITDSSEAPPHPALIVAKTHASALLPAAAANSGDEADALIIAAGYALTTPPRDVAVAANAGLLENPGTMSPQNTRGILLEVPMMSGMGGLVSQRVGRPELLPLQWH